MAKNWSGRLPNGGTTNSPREYAQAWHALADPIASAFNLTVVGWDPGILFRHTDSASTVDLPAWFAADLRALIEQADRA